MLKSRGSKLRTASNRRKQARSHFHHEPLEDRRMLATLTVTTTDDVVDSFDNVVSLREAITDANPGDTIDFDFGFALGGTIQMSQSLGTFTIDKSMTIDGSDYPIGGVAIDADGIDRVMMIDDGDSSQMSTVVLENIGIVGGETHADGTVGAGAGIHNREFLALRQSWVRGNQTFGSQATGGGIYSEGGTVDLDFSIVEDNRSNDGSGGGVASVDGQLIFVTDSTIAGNFASFQGGGIYSTETEVNVSHSTIDNNSSDTLGGGIYHKDEELLVRSSTISRNYATANGGGIYTDTYLPSDGPGADIWLSTISNNRSDLIGGGIHNNDGLTRIFSSTVTENVAVNGGGVSSYGDLRTITEVNSSIIAGNLGSTDLWYFNGLVDSFSSLGFNVVGDGDIGSFSSSLGDQTLVLDPGLGPLAYNGGPTETHRLLPGSPAIDAGDPAPTVVGFVFDQRGLGFNRIGGAQMDAGSFELLGDLNDDGQFDCQDINALTNAIASGSTDPLYDLTGEGLVDMADLDRWLIEVGNTNLGPGRAYLPGDANLDGVVDAADFLIWNANKFVSGAGGWCVGDFNADGTVDASDFLIWNSNKFMSSSPPAPASGADSGFAMSEDQGLDPVDQSGLGQVSSDRVTPIQHVSRRAAAVPRSVDQLVRSMKSESREATDQFATLEAAPVRLL